MNIVVINALGRPTHTAWLANEQDLPTSTVEATVLPMPEGVTDIDLLENHVYSGNEWLRRPSGVAQVCVYTDGTWVDPRSVADLKILKNAEINAARLVANNGTFTYTGKQIAADSLSRSDIDAVNGIVAITGALPPGFPGGWKCVDNTYVPIQDKATWVVFYGAMVAQGTTNFAHSQTLKTQLVAATTAAEVDAVQWSQ